MDARGWLSRTGLKLEVAQVREAQQRLWAVLEEAKRASLPATPSALSALYQYRVPKLSPDGSCSLIDELDPQPYDLGDVLGGRSVQTSFALITLFALVEQVHDELKCDWLGLYQARTVAAGPALVKLASRGLESRAEFPLTDAFAAQSNNVAVARSGQPVLLDDVAAHREQGGAYYECDPKVQSEVCLPLFDPNGTVVGVLDAESFHPGFFTEARLCTLVALAMEAPGHFPR